MQVPRTGSPNLPNQSTFDWALLKSRKEAQQWKKHSSESGQHERSNRGPTGSGSTRTTQEQWLPKLIIDSDHLPPYFTLRRQHTCGRLLTRLYTTCGLQYPSHCITSTDVLRICSRFLIPRWSVNTTMHHSSGSTSTGYVPMRVPFSWFKIMQE